MTISDIDTSEFEVITEKAKSIIDSEITESFLRTLLDKPEVLPPKYPDLGYREIPIKESPVDWVKYSDEDIRADLVSEIITIPQEGFFFTCEDDWTKNAKVITMYLNGKELARQVLSSMFIHEVSEDNIIREVAHAFIEFFENDIYKAIEEMKWK